MKNVAVDEAERLVDIRGDKRLPVDGITLENVRVAKALKPDRIENAVTFEVSEAKILRWVTRDRGYIRFPNMKLLEFSENEQGTDNEQ